MTLLNHYIEWAKRFVGRFVEGEKWKLKLAMLCCIVVPLSFFNNLSPLKSFGDMYTAVVKEKSEYFLYQTVEDRAGNLTGNFDYEPYSGKESRTFRLVMPLVTRLLGIQHITVTFYILQLVLGFLFFYLLAGFLHEILDDRLQTALASLALCGIYLGACFFIDNAGYGDFYSFFFLFLALFFRKKPLLVFLFLELAFWNDERAFVGSGLVFVWLWWYPQYVEEAKTYRIKFTWSMLAVVIAWLVWGAGRYYLMEVKGMMPTYNPDGEFAIRVKQSVESLGFRLWWQFEGWWLLFILAGLILWNKKQYLGLLVISGAALASMLGAMIIYDSTRSGNFAFIATFFALAIAKRELTRKQMTLILLGIAMLCLLHPLANKTHGVGFFLM
ncbi:hypothetical protein LAG90_15095 [Marinilongibacter aquaticus]|uniref:hypothetical protein n=1 Tax=Marinilongibacter aquaticus TaxID=2975157 RepID=UPI0021BD8747|nr:hypothetical protein [Marinilongibacter aquaticus]UBM58131.1 hypothetical protein LAG90_15095 [Marinilongibacter aquaticus]